MTSDTAAVAVPSGQLATLPLRLHHRAIVVRDQEATRHFFEDIIGLPLVACWCEATYMPEVDRTVEYCHTFFALGDGSALAFFQFADREFEERTVRTHFPPIPRYDHIALKVSQKTQDDIVARLEAHGIKYRITNHGYCRSVYVTSPDGLYLEFAHDPPEAAEIDRIQRADAHAHLARWLRGERETNNSYATADRLRGG